MTEKPVQMPKGMRRVHGRFERWRKAHQGRGPLPDAFWKAAADLAREHGVFRTAKVLRLDYNKLKTLAAGGDKAEKRRTTAPAAFVELLPAPPHDSLHCLIELERPQGKVRIEWRGATTAMSPD